MHAWSGRKTAGRIGSKVSSMCPPGPGRKRSRRRQKLRYASPKTVCITAKSYVDYVFAMPNRLNK